MVCTRFISAIGTPLDTEEGLHKDGLFAHINAQWEAGISGLLVAGTMGLLPLLRDETYRQLVLRAVEYSRGRGELLVGAGDCGYARTRDRIAFLNEHAIDGVVVLCPYFMTFSQLELREYFHSLADFSKRPIYLYHLPATTKTELAWETVERLAEHPNIAGIKCSCDMAWTLELMRRVGDRFRVIMAAADQITALVHRGVLEHLDGIFALAPEWTTAIGRAADAADRAMADYYQGLMNQLLETVRSLGVFPTFTALLNARGIPGNYAPAPYTRLDETILQQLMDRPVVRQLLNGAAPSRPADVPSPHIATGKVRIG